MDYGRSFEKYKVGGGNLDGRKLDRWCFEGNRAWLPRRIKPIIRFGYCGHQISIARYQIHCLAIKEHFRCRKILINTLLDELPAVVLKNRRYNSQEKIRKLLFLWFVPVVKLAEKETFPGTITSNIAIQAENCCEILVVEISVSCFEKNWIRLSRQMIQKCKFLLFQLINFPLSETKCIIWDPCSFEITKSWLIPWLMRYSHSFMRKTGLFF